MKANPRTTAPALRRVLIKHEHLGWIEATFDPNVYAKSVVEHGAEHGGFGWSSPASASGEWLYHRHVQAWAELPEGD
jgi:hypothetical protein